MINHNSNEGYLENVDGIRQKTLLVEFRLTGGKSLPLHSHPHEQTGYLVSGKLNMTIGEQQFLFTPGDSWTIPGYLQEPAAFRSRCGGRPARRIVPVLTKKPAGSFSY